MTAAFCHFLLLLPPVLILLPGEVQFILNKPNRLGSADHAPVKTIDRVSCGFKLLYTYQPICWKQSLPLWQQQIMPPETTNGPCDAKKVYYAGHSPCDSHWPRPCHPSLWRSQAEIFLVKCTCMMWPRQEWLECYQQQYAQLWIIQHFT